jgi:hypothetical protein
MDEILLVSDNLSELLVKVVQFTDSRRGLLHENMHSVHTLGFMPQDLPVFEFVHVLNGAIAEHLQTGRLLLRDTENIKFGPNGTMCLYPVPDRQAHTLLQSNHNEYLEYQVNRLLENALNRKVAEELLKLKRGAPSDLAYLHIAQTWVENSPFKGSSTPCENAE